MNSQKRHPVKAAYDMMDGVDIMAMEHNNLKKIEAPAIALGTQEGTKLHHLWEVKVANR